MTEYKCKGLSGFTVFVRKRSHYLTCDKCCQAFYLGEFGRGERWQPDTKWLFNMAAHARKHDPASIANRVRARGAA